MPLFIIKNNANWKNGGLRANLGDEARSKFPDLGKKSRFEIFLKRLLCKKQPHPEVALPLKFQRKVDYVNKEILQLLHFK